MPTEPRHPVEILAEEFADRLRRGETPSIEEYAQRLPEQSDTIRKVFTPILAIERLSDGQLADQQFEARTARLARDHTQLGDFRIVRQVGRGGMGVVYEAIQQSLGRRVALKLLSPEVASSAEQLRRFQLEAATFAKLHHTNIVPVFGIGEADGLHFYAMQFIDGITLANAISQLSRPQSLTNATKPGTIEHALAASSTKDFMRTVARLGRDVAGALQHAHEQGIVHRDIKPGNLMLEDATVWVTDFGIAKLTDETSQTKTGLLLGTLRYMAPEQFNGQADARSDIYSLGLTLFELLTLQPAFADATHATLIKTKLSESTLRLRALRPDVPRDLETIILKAGATDSQTRYQTADALAEDLQRFLDDRPILARRASSVERLVRWSRRNPTVAGLSFAVVASLAALAIVSAGGNYRMRQTLDQLQAAKQLADQNLREKGVALDVAEQQRSLAANNLALAIEAFEEIMHNIGSRSGSGGLSVELNDGDVAYGAGVVTDADAEMLGTLLRFFDRFGTENTTSLLKETAAANRRVGDILYQLGRVEEAETSYLTALDQINRLAAENAADEMGDDSNETLGSIVEKLQILNALGLTVSAQGALEEAQQYYRQTADVYLADTAAQKNSSAQFEYARALNLRTSTFSRIGFPQARPLPREARGNRESPPARRQNATKSPDPALRRARAAFAATARQVHRDSKTLNQEAIRLLGALVEAHPKRVDFAIELTHAYREQARIARLELDSSTAHEANRAALELLERLLRDNSESPYFRFVFADTVTSMPVGASRRNGLALSRAIRIAGALVREYPSMPDYLALKAKALLARGDSDSSADAVSILEQLVDDYPAMAQYRLLLASGLQRLSNIDFESQRIGSAQERLEQAIAVLEADTESDQRPAILNIYIDRLKQQLEEIQQ
ncbi:MAG: serine/threonine-protein kinase [Pirellulaceae bacterium]